MDINKIQKSAFILWISPLFAISLLFLWFSCSETLLKYIPPIPFFVHPFQIFLSLNASVLIYHRFLRNLYLQNSPTKQDFERHHDDRSNMEREKRNQSGRTLQNAFWFTTAVMLCHVIFNDYNTFCLACWKRRRRNDRKTH